MRCDEKMFRAEVELLPVVEREKGGTQTRSSSTVEREDHLYGQAPFPNNLY